MLAELQVMVNRMSAAHPFFGPGAEAAHAQRVAREFGSDQRPLDFNPDARHGVWKMPTFNYGRQSCPDPFMGNNKNGFKDYAFCMANFLAMSTINYQQV